MANLFQQDDFRTIDCIRKGFVKCIFYTPSMVVNALQKMFGDGEVKIVMETPTELSIECKSYDWCANKYYRAFIFSYVKCPNNKDFRISGVIEVGNKA